MGFGQALLVIFPVLLDYSSSEIPSVSIAIGVGCFHNHMRPSVRTELMLLFATCWCARAA